jgi:hypothetical protein
MTHCYHCGREIKAEHRYVAVLVIERHTGRIGTAKLHSDCCCLPNLVRYKQTVQWESTITNLSNLKRLIGRIQASNESRSGSIPLFLT